MARIQKQWKKLFITITLLLFCFTVGLVLAVDPPTGIGCAYAWIADTDSDYYEIPHLYRVRSGHNAWVKNTSPPGGREMYVKFTYGNGFDFDIIGDIDPPNPAYADLNGNKFIDEDEMVEGNKTNQTYEDPSSGFYELGPQEDKTLLSTGTYIENFQQYQNNASRQCGAYTYAIAYDSHGHDVVYESDKDDEMIPQQR